MVLVVVLDGTIAVCFGIGGGYDAPGGFVSFLFSEMSKCLKLHNIISKYDTLVVLGGNLHF